MITHKFVFHTLSYHFVKIQKPINFDLRRKCQLNSFHLPIVHVNITSHLKTSSIFKLGCVKCRKKTIDFLLENRTCRHLPIWKTWIDSMNKQDLHDLINMQRQNVFDKRHLMFIQIFILVIISYSWPWMLPHNNIIVYSRWRHSTIELFLILHLTTLVATNALRKGMSL